VRFLLFAAVRFNDTILHNIRYGRMDARCVLDQQPPSFCRLIG
jgi:hypothetical protein